MKYRTKAYQKKKLYSLSGIWWERYLQLKHVRLWEQTKNPLADNSDRTGSRKMMSSLKKLDLRHSKEKSDQFPLGNGRFVYSLR